ncbi:MAG TPA: hypothetical protein VNE62_07880, partial [Actinomycetota bacterium]|nr:hypothetical protein [Actinomycetota bacterium]
SGAFGDGVRHHYHRGGIYGGRRYDPGYYDAPAPWEGAYLGRTLPDGYRERGSRGPRSWLSGPSGDDWRRSSSGGGDWGDSSAGGSSAGGSSSSSGSAGSGSSSSGSGSSSGSTAGGGDW